MFKIDEHWIFRYQSHENFASMTSLGIMQDHHCGLGITSLPLTQRARVQFPVGSISLRRFFPGFSLNRKTNVRKFGPLYIIRLRMATVSDHSSSTWPSLNNKTTTAGIVQKPAWLHQHTHCQWNFSFSRTDLSTHLPPFHRLHNFLGFSLLLP